MIRRSRSRMLTWRAAPPPRRRDRLPALSRPVAVLVAMFGFPGVLSPTRGDADQPQAASSVPAAGATSGRSVRHEKSKPSAFLTHLLPAAAADARRRAG